MARPGRLWNVLRALLAVLCVALLAGGAYAWLVGSVRAPAQVLAAGAPGMQAIMYRDYGGPEELHVETVAKPVPADDQLLVRVHAAAVNPLDWHYLRGTPYLLRIDAGLRYPQDPRLGTDFAGTVESVGTAVTKFKAGDAVFGGAAGAFGEYVLVRETRAVAAKPANVTFEEAAAVPIAALTALQALRDKGALKPGQKVLINGASGGVGTFAVQIAKALGGEVTGVCSTRNLGLVRSLGADHVIDYTKADFVDGARRYDLIVDTVGNRPLLEIRRALAPKGVLVMVGEQDMGNWVGPLLRPLRGLLLSLFGSRRFDVFLAKLPQADLAAVGELMAAGKVTSVIDRRYSLSALPDAIRYLEAGHARGKVIIDVDDMAATH
jgi:NADPH:quinone reductase-like Zn-dependent oxidoreductase